MATTTTAAAAIDIGELEQELSRTRAMFEQWSAKIHARATGCKASHTSKLLAHKGLLSGCWLVLYHCHNNTLLTRSRPPPLTLCVMLPAVVSADEMAALEERYQRAEKQAAQVRQRE